jgi:hypothetical protein
LGHDKAPCVALIKGDGIGVDVSDAAISAVDAACATTGAPQLISEEMQACTRCTSETDRGIDVDGEERWESAKSVAFSRAPTIQSPKLSHRIMRYELADHEWVAVKPMLPNKPRGVPRANDRRVNGIFWLCDPERLGAICRRRLAPTQLATTASFAGEQQASGAVS